jgi:hypothetical protein
MADQEKIGADAHSLHAGLAHGHEVRHAAHLQIVRQNQAAVADAFPEHISNPETRYAGWPLLFFCQRIRRVAHHHHRQFIAQRAVRSQILLPQLLPCAANLRRFQVRIERSAAETGEMLPASSHALRRQPSEKRPRIRDDLRRRRSRAPSSQYLLRRWQPQIKHRRQWRVESECLHRPRNQLSVLSRNPTSPARPRSSRHRLHRRNRRQRVPQPIHRSALHIHKARAMRRAESRRFGQQRPRLPRILNVSAKQNNPRRAKQLQPRALQSGQLRSFEPHHQQTSCRFTKRSCTHPDFSLDRSSAPNSFTFRLINSYTSSLIHSCTYSLITLIHSSLSVRDAHS